MRDIGHELGPDLLELAERGDVVEHHRHAGLTGAQAKGHGVDLQDPLDRSGQPELASDRRPVSCHLDPRRAPLAKHVVEIGVADHFQERFSLQAARSQVEHGARPLVHEQDVIVAVHRDHALHHAVEDGGDLGLLLREVLDLLAEPGGEHVEGAAEGADLVRGVHGGAHGEVALAELAGDGLHLDHRARHPSRHEEADAERHREGQQPAHQHHPMHVFVGGGHLGERQGQPHYADDAVPIARGGGDIEQRRLERAADAQIAADPTGERCAHFRAVGVTLHTGEATRPRVRLRHHTAVGPDQGHAGAGGARRPLGEGLPDRFRGRPAQEIARLVVKHALERHQAGLQRLHRVGLQRVIEVQRRREPGDGGEAHQGQRELQRDTAAEKEQEPPHAQPSGSSR